MTDDIVARLREVQYKFSAVPKENKLVMSPQNVADLGSLWHEAADEIERLRKERDTARSIACDNFAGRATVNKRAKSLWFMRHMKWDQEEIGHEH